MHSLLTLATALACAAPLAAAAGGNGTLTCKLGCILPDTIVGNNLKSAGICSSLTTCGSADACFATVLTTAGEATSNDTDASGLIQNIELVLLNWGLSLLTDVKFFGCLLSDMSSNTGTLNNLLPSVENVARQINVNLTAGVDVCEDQKLGAFSAAFTTNADINYDVSNATMKVAICYSNECNSNSQCVSGAEGVPKALALLLLPLLLLTRSD